MKFENAKQMYDYLHEGRDLYSKSLGVYVFEYNDAGALCTYDLYPDDVIELINKSKKYKEYWAAFLGWKGSAILDDSEYDDFRYVEDYDKWALYAKPSLDFCEDTFNIEDWMDTDDATIEYMLDFSKYKIGSGTYNIGFNNGDETQFDVENVEELKECWVEFCKENNFSVLSIDYIEED